MWVAVVATVLSTVVSVAGAVQQGQAAKNAAEYNSEVAQQNASLAAQNTASQIAIDKQQSAQNALQNTRQLAALRAAYGSSGLELSGSSLDSLQDSSNQMALNNAQVDFQQQVDKRNGAVQVLQLEDQSNLDIAQGKNSATAGYMQAGTSLLSGTATATKLAVDGGVYTGGN